MTTLALSSEKAVSTSLTVLKLNNIYVGNAKTTSCLVQLVALSRTEASKRIAKETLSTVAVQGEKAIKGHAEGIVVDAVITALIPVFPPLAFLLLLRKGMSVLEAYASIRTVLNDVNSSVKSAKEEFKIYRYSNPDNSTRYEVFYLKPARYDEKLERVESIYKELEADHNDVDINQSDMTNEKKLMGGTVRDDVNQKSINTIVEELMTDLITVTNPGDHSVRVVMSDSHEKEFENALSNREFTGIAAQEFNAKEYSKELFREMNEQQRLSREDGLLVKHLYQLLEKAGDTKEKLPSLSDLPIPGLDSARETLSGASGAAKEAGKKLGGTVGSLFKKKKENED